MEDGHLQELGYERIFINLFLAVTLFKKHIQLISIFVCNFCC